MEHRKVSLQERSASERPGRAGSEALWGKLAPLRTDPRVITANRIVTTSRLNPAHTVFDMMRTKLLQQLQQNNWTTVAITSPTPGCGKTFVALNLAFSLANQRECRTVLVDLDLKRPQVAKMLGVGAPTTIENFLKGEGEIADVFLRHNDNLAIGANSQAVSFSAELLQSRETVKVLQEMRQRMCPDVVLFDMPPMLSNDDVMAFLPNVDCVILVAAAEQSTLGELDICEHELSERTNVLGVVLNKCRFAPEKYGY
ncbi:MULTISPECIES: CpsD/CapB family tyrosine-protein kinase [unclassified Sinorhizobium]|uniref:CpsD/CapB family tyrosine-protein kinase n=1 Tax=unclassified Sinorhizobium TaxID=2613772 RepID=UPI0024C3EDED|nr:MULTISPECIES: CpsD/CapB family tyrosine-protein kinase [unclassified Sinorhizobium]MDK1374012.1 CpsD/CapB family tyrosine-protein kinase [Sinorhizobium sp. 6-70]MDK1477425.1 CpsD/CapB family tyrosine-protein kinase [Sinorhizobium sp. 6-117]